MSQGSINLAVRRYKFEYLEITDKTTTMEINKWAENINTKDVVWRLISNHGADCINENNSIFVVAIPSVETLPNKKHDLKIYSKEDFHAAYSTDFATFPNDVDKISERAALDSKAKMAQPAAKKNLADIKTNIGPNVNIGLGVSHISGPGNMAPRTEILGDAWGVNHKGDMHIGASGSGLDEVSKNILKNMNKQLGRDTRY